MINLFSLAPFKQRFDQTHPLDQVNPQVSSAVKLPEQQSATHFVRAAHSEDLSNIATLLSESFYPAHGLMSWFSPLFRLGIYQDLRGRITTSAKQLCLVALQGSSGPQPSGYEALVGTVEVTLRSLTPYQCSSPKYPYISNLAVKKEFRRQGIAQHLLLACARTVQGWGYQDLYLHVLEDNQPARQLYARSGYQLDRADPVWTASLLHQPQRLLLRNQLR